MQWKDTWNKTMPESWALKQYCNNCKKETPHNDITKKGDINKTYKCAICGYDKVIVQGFNYDLF